MAHEQSALVAPIDPDAVDHSPSLAAVHWVSLSTPYAISAAAGRAFVRPPSIHSSAGASILRRSSSSFAGRNVPWCAVLCSFSRRNMGCELMFLRGSDENLYHLYRVLFCSLDRPGSLARKRLAIAMDRAAWPCCWRKAIFRRFQSSLNAGRCGQIAIPEIRRSRSQSDAS